MSDQSEPLSLRGTQILRNVRRRPWWRCTGDFLAVRPVRLSAGHTIHPGEPVAYPADERHPDGRPLRKFHLQVLYRRFMIGDAEDPWTTQQLLAYGARLERQHQRQPEATPPGPALRVLRALGLAKPPAQEPAVLEGSANLPGQYVSEAGLQSLGDLVGATVQLLEVDAAEWNALPEDERDEYLRQAVQHLGWTPVEGS